MTKITKVVGFPGTGKTYFLENVIEKKLNYGASLNDILFTSFSRATMRNAFERLKNMGYDGKDLSDNLRTLHSFSARALGLHNKEEFIGSKDYQKFCYDEGIQFQPFHVRTISEIEKFGTTGEEYYSVPGNIMLHWWQFLKKKYVYDKNVRNAILQRRDIGNDDMMKLDIYPPEYLLHLYNEWEMYKENYGKWEYDDMLSYIVNNEIGFHKEVKYFIVDEFQDINNLQFELIKLWSKNCDELIISGDPFQAIYFFSAADPTLMNKLEGETDVLPRSYRVPEIPWGVARRVARYIGNGNSLMDKVASANIDGSVEYLDYYNSFRKIKSITYIDAGNNGHISKWNGDGNGGVNSNANANSGSGSGSGKSKNKSKNRTFLLFRTHYQIRKFLQHCFDENIYVLGMGRAVTCFNSPKYMSIYNTLRKLYRKEPLDIKDIRTFITSIPAKYLVRGVKTKAQKKGKYWLDGQLKQERLFDDSDSNDLLNLFFSFFKSVDDASGIKDIISDPKTRISNKDILLGISPTSPPVRTNIFVGTYFASKGLEAGNVFCFDYFPRQDANIRRDEARIVFVGLTRTLFAVYIISPEKYYDAGLIHDITS